MNQQNETDLDADQQDSALALTPLRQALEDCRSAFYFMGGLAFVITLLSVAPILYTMNVFDRVIPTNSMITLVSLLSLVIGAYFFWTALEWLRSRMMVRISLRIDWDLAAEVFDACFKRSLNQRDPNVHQVMGDLLTLRQFMTGRSILILIDAPFAVVFMILSYLIHPFLAAFVVVSTLILVAVTLYTRKITTPAIRAANQHNMEANRLAAAGLRNADTAYSMGMLPLLRQRWHEKHRSFLQYQVNSSEANGYIGMIGGVFTKALPTLKITVGVVLAGGGLISAGGVIAAGFLMTKAIAPMRELILHWEDFVKAKMAYERLDALLHEQHKASEKMALPDPVGQLKVEGLVYRAPGTSRDILKGLDFELPAGKVLAIVGPNAAGKTTLLRTVLGILEPSDGVVRLDGAEVWTWDHEHLGPHIGYVAQTPDLFEATVAQNIARLDVVDSESVVRAAQLAGVHEMILSFPDGYDTLLGTGGFMPSGGQCQRLTIARAFYRQPKLIVLDEPNANLDEPSEKALLSGILALRDLGSTIVFTSHRPKLIAASDWLLVLKDGRQVAFGPTRDILGNQAEFTAKVSTQGALPHPATSPSQEAITKSQEEEAIYDGQEIIAAAEAKSPSDDVGQTKTVVPNEAKSESAQDNPASPFASAIKPIVFKGSKP